MTPVCFVLNIPRSCFGPDSYEVVESGDREKCDRWVEENRRDYPHAFVVERVEKDEW